jgi:pantoate--beta-alanine ligase
MEIYRSAAQMQHQAQAWKREGHRIGLVPTMGYLHEGHLSLIRRARQESDVVVVSIFVNPSQFGPTEDLDQYPRDFDRDRELCAREGVEAIFAPGADDVYAEDHSTWVVEDTLSKPLCGVTRPIHFRGVATVVAKLFNIALPDVAVFGQKDAQQVLVIQRMVRDLNFPLAVLVAPIVREADGLAMSSRNRYLSAEQRQQALSLSRGLKLAAQAYGAGERNATRLREQLATEIEACGGRIDYIELRCRQSLAPMEEITGPALLALAVYFGDTRLIDNCFLG